MKKIKKNLVIAAFIVGAIITFQLSLDSLAFEQDAKLSQLVREAKACIETDDGVMQCCVGSGWCYIGGGYEISPYFPYYGW